MERELRPIYGPWRIYTKEEEDALIIASLARQDRFNRGWENRKANRNGPSV